MKLKNLQFLTFCVALLLVVPGVNAQTFHSLTPTTCPTSSSGLFTTGQQYVDPNNGVLKDKWSMLVRWQGTPTVGSTQWYSNLLNYDAGVWTSYTPPMPYSTWQRGYQPENQAAATPGVQLHGCDAGMIINTWYTPHAGTSVTGGYFNDMYGYAWSNTPWAFKYMNVLGSYAPSELVLQSDLAVPAIDGYQGTYSNSTWTWSQVSNIHDANSFGHVQYSLFAYIADSTHPNLHPIAIISTVFENGITAPTYSCPQYANVFYDYANGSNNLGVWATSSGICSTDTTTARYSGGYTTGTPFSTSTFFRIHITPQNLTNLINRINNLECAPGQANSCTATNSSALCTPGTTCPNIGYSTNPNFYKLQYIGVIAEVAPCDQDVSGVHCSTNLLQYNPNQDSNVGAAVNAHGVSAYAYTTP